MENIVIKDMLYKCKNGTVDKIEELLRTGEKAPAKLHENGTAYLPYNDFLEKIQAGKTTAFIDGIYQPY
jgi:hypothetical protein